MARRNPLVTQHLERISLQSSHAEILEVFEGLSDRPVMGLNKGSTARNAADGVQIHGVGGKHLAVHLDVRLYHVEHGF